MFGFGQRSLWERPCLPVLWWEGRLSGPATQCGVGLEVGFLSMSFHLGCVSGFRIISLPVTQLWDLLQTHQSLGYP